ATLHEAIAEYARPAVQVAIVDGAIVAEDVGAWQRVRSADTRRVALILTSMTPHDPAVDRFGTEEAAAALVPPFELSALHAAVRAGSKECV
ncbi:MAG: hypothetical protein ACRD15_13835, partial [Vicinamibacterales bacterium]